MAASSRQPLTAERIETAALALIDREGLEGFSIRKLADGLGCQAMSLYHHYPSKAHLLDALLDRLLLAAPLLASGEPWRDRMRHAARAFRRIALAHPRFFPFVATHRMNTRVGLAWLEGVLEIYRDSGLDAEAAARRFRIFGYFLMGAGLDETAGYSAGATAANPVPDEEVAARFPNVVAAGRWFQPGEREATFELGLAILLDSFDGG
jgi:AcrR family transcriptional regulator